MSSLPSLGFGLSISALSVALLAGCSGGGSSGTAPIPVNAQFCGNDTQYALARPQSGQSIPSGSSTVEIVASGTNNQISQSFKNFDLLFVPVSNNGPTVSTNSLSPTSDRGGYAPFSSDFYYDATIATTTSAGGLAPGTLYNVFVNAFTSNCTPVGPIGQVGTP